MDGSTRDRYGRISMDGWYERILLYDSGEHNLKALRLAAKVAAENGATLTVAEVVPAGVRGFMDRVAAFSDGRHGDTGRAERERRLHRWLVAETPPGVDVFSAVFEGTPSAEIVRAVLDHEYDLVIVTEEDHAILRGVFDMTASRIARHCPCPVWMVKRTAKGRVRRVTAAIGFGGPERALGAVDREIVAAAVNIARSEGCRLDIVRPWDFRGPDLQTSRSELPPDIYEAFYERYHHARADSVKRMLRRLGIGGPNVVVHLPHGAPDSSVARFVEENDVDVLVMGIDSERHPPGLFPNPIVESVTARVHCSVLIIKSPDFACPVAMAHSPRSLATPPLSAFTAPK